jgi:hypothetical protein
MSALTRYLYPLPARRTPGSIIAWWERRRLGYNLVVGSAGLVSLLVLTTGMALTGNLPGWTPGPILVFGALANLYYTLGWILEVGAHLIWGDEVAPLGPALSRAGIIFSAGLALLPVLALPLFLAGWLLDLLV